MICEQGDFFSFGLRPPKKTRVGGKALRGGSESLGHQQAVRADAYRLLMPPGNGCPLHVPIADDNPIYGFVQCEVLRSVDLGARERGGHAGAGWLVG